MNIFYTLIILHLIDESLCHQTLFFSSTLHTSSHNFTDYSSKPDAVDRPYIDRGSSVASISLLGTDGLYSIALDYREGSGKARRFLPYLFNQTGVDWSDICPENNSSLINYNVTMIHTNHESPSRRIRNHGFAMVVHTDNGQTNNQDSLSNGYYSNGRTAAVRKTNGNGNGVRRNGRIPPVRFLRIKSLSLDSVSGRFLLQMINKDESRFSLAIGQACEPLKPLSEINCTIEPEHYSEPQSLSRYISENSLPPPPAVKTLFYQAKTLEFAKIGPVAFFNSNIYFILQRRERPDYKTKLNVIELRRLSSVCRNGNPILYPVTSSSSTFDVLECSVIVANITREVYDKYYFYRPLDSLAVLMSESTGNIHFYFQIQKLFNLTQNGLTLDNPPTSFNVSILLYHAWYCPSCSTPGAEGPQSPQLSPNVSRDGVEAVHEETVSSGYFKFELLQLGGVSWRGEMLCWAPIDRILCGRVSQQTGKLDRIRMHLPAGQAEQVCRVTPADDGLSGVISGLAVAAANDREELAMYFGCVAQMSGLGGAGLLRVRLDNRRLITPLRLPDGTALKAGAMFVLEKCGVALNVSSKRSPFALISLEIITSLILILIRTFKLSPD